MNGQNLLGRFPLARKKKLWKKLASIAIPVALLSAVFGMILRVLWTLFVSKVVDPSMPYEIVMGVLYGLVLFVIMQTIYYWYVHFYIKTYFYDSDKDFITIKKGVFTPTEIHIQYQKIQDVYVDQDLLDRIFGLYDVHVSSATYTSGIEAHIDGLDKVAAEGLKQFLLDIVRNPRSSGEVSGQNASQVVSTSVASETVASNPLDTLSLEQIKQSEYPFSLEWYVGQMISLCFKAILSLSGILIYLLLVASNDKKGTETLLQTYAGEIVLGVIGIQFVFSLARLVLWVKNYHYEFGKDFILYRTGVLAISETHMPYNSIQNVVTKQTLTDRILGLADIVIENAAQSSPVNAIARRNQMQASTQGQVIIKGLFAEEASRFSQTIRKVILDARTTSSNKGL